MFDNIRQWVQQNIYGGSYPTNDTTNYYINFGISIFIIFIVYDFVLRMVKK